jgi:uncharacterized membrane protein
MFALAVCYPLLAHFAVVKGSEVLTAASLGALALAVLLPGLARWRIGAWLSGVAIAAVLALLARSSLAWLPLYAPAIVTDLAGAWLFARTLRLGRVPLIERIVRLLHAPEEQLDPAIVVYARRLTAGWAALFGVLAAVSLGLALCAAPNGILLLIGLQPPVTVPQEAWSLFANFIEYGIFAAFFAIEYAYRRQRFPQQPYANMLDFLRRMLRVAPAAFGAPSSSGARSSA